MSELKFYTKPVVDCLDFDNFVREVYGVQYSSVQGLNDWDYLSHYSYYEIDVEEWKSNRQWMIDNDEWFNEQAFYDWLDKKEIGYAAMNYSPEPEEMVSRLIADGHDVPAKFMMLVDW